MQQEGNKLKKALKSVQLLISSLTAALSLSACGLSPNALTNNVASVRGAEVEAVLARVKQEVGLFLEDSVAVNQNWQGLLHDLGDIHPVCGNGHIDFNITNVKMDFTAVSDVTGGANAGLKIPVLPVAAAASISPAAKVTYENKSTEEINYIYYPPTAEEFQNTWAAAAKAGHGLNPNEFDSIRPKAVIVPALDALRDGLIKATAHYPCFLNAASTAPDSTLVFTVVLTEDKNVSGGFNFYIVSVAASADNNQSGTNTITVSFHPNNPGLKTAPAKPKT
jgi:hypothetical protein